MTAAAAAGLAIAVPAYAAGARPAAPGSARPTTERQSPALRGPGLISPLHGMSPRTAARAATASSTCVRYATRAGWANNGYFAGDLVTAAAICVAESAGDPKLIVCDKKGQVDESGDYPGFKCPVDATSYDRGLWQLNTAVPGAVNNQCAFNPVCNAQTAYLASGRGTSFAPWSSYDQDVYTKFIDAAQAAVTGLRSGTLTSALLGECLVQSKQAVGAKVVIANCGNGAANQQWSVSGGKLRSGSLCAAISSTSAASPGIVLRRCAAHKVQQWSVTGRFELRNKGEGNASPTRATASPRAPRCTSPAASTPRTRPGGCPSRRDRPGSWGGGQGQGGPGSPSRARARANAASGSVTSTATAVMPTAVAPARLTGWSSRNTMSVGSTPSLPVISR